METARETRELSDPHPLREDAGPARFQETERFPEPGARSERAIPDLLALGRAACAPPGAPAAYLDERDAGDERPVASEEDARALAAAWERGERGFVALAVGRTGLDVYRHAAIAKRILAGRVPVRVRWGEAMGIKAAALALLYGADELCGPLAPAERARRIAIVGGPPEDPARPTRAHVEALIRAAGRTPVRRPA